VQLVGDHATREMGWSSWLGTMLQGRWGGVVGWGLCYKEQSEGKETTTLLGPLGRANLNQGP
jgi:hypothetical protein